MAGVDPKQDVAQIEVLQSHLDAHEIDPDTVTSKGNYAVETTEDSRFAAVVARSRPHPLSKGLLMLYPVLFVAFMNSAANGFDGNTFGGVSALPDFESRFGTDVAASQGFLAALYILGESSVPHNRSEVDIQ